MSVVSSLMLMVGILVLRSCGFLMQLFIVYLNELLKDLMLFWYWLRFFVVILFFFIVSEYVSRNEFRVVLIVECIVKWNYGLLIVLLIGFQSFCLLVEREIIFLCFIGKGSVSGVWCFFLGYGRRFCILIGSVKKFQLLMFLVWCFLQNFLMLMWFFFCLFVMVRGFEILSLRLLLLVQYLR